MCGTKGGIFDMDMTRRKALVELGGCIRETEWDDYLLLYDM